MFYSTIFFHLLTRDKLFNCDIFFPRKSNRFAFREIRLMGNVFILFIFDLSKSRVERAYPRKSSVLRDCVASGFPFAPRYARDCSTFFYFISFFLFHFRCAQASSLILHEIVAEAKGFRFEALRLTSYRKNSSGVAELYTER